jgi:magnesium-transporting ATPase (P-type)
MRLLAQFHNLLIYVLLGAALIAGVMGHWVDNIVILGVVLVAVSVVVTLQLFFTYVPFMERFFGTRPVDCVQGVEIIALGVALYMIVELEKLTLRKWRRKHDGSSGCPGRSEAKS